MQTEHVFVGNIQEDLGRVNETLEDYLSLFTYYSLEKKLFFFKILHVFCFVLCLRHRH